jgi:serine/threonine-protein kinase
MSRDDEVPTEVAIGTVDERLIKPDMVRPAPTDLIGRYRIARLIGKGGMGEVLTAHDEQVGRDVAIKRMRSANPSERAIQRFLREASIQGRLEHPAICPVHEIGRDAEGMPFFAMKKLTGTTLAKLLIEPDPAQFPLQRILRAFADVCLAMEMAHVRGIVHRDLKPDNIMLGDYGEVYVLDWGVAKVIGDDEGEFSDVGSHSSQSGEFETAVGTSIGTPGYMAPEQVRGRKEIDGRADIYTLGCLLFEILAGEALHPRGAEGLASSLAGIDARPSQRAPGRQIPPELDALCVAATMVDPNQRIQTARELGNRVQRFLDGDRDLALRKALARDHYQRATTAFAGGDVEEQRRIAMREAASAIALDPSLDGAAELVGRLMLEPPRDTPREVEVLIDAEDIEAARVNAGAGIWAVIAGLAYIPLLWWIAPSFFPYVGALSTVLLAMGVLSVYNYRAKRPWTGLVVLGNAILCLLASRMYSPILIAPAFAAVLAMAMVFTPRFSWVTSGLSVALAMIVAVLSPFALERLGVISPTISVSNAGLLLNAPAISGNEGAVLAVGVLYMVLLIAGACAMAETLRVRNRDAKRQLHIQAWQLRQLVPR